jgi:hypothetical protein
VFPGGIDWGSVRLKRLLLGRRVLSSPAQQSDGSCYRLTEGIVTGRQGLRVQAAGHFAQHIEAEFDKVVLERGLSFLIVHDRHLLWFTCEPIDLDTVSISLGWPDWITL